MSTVCRKSKTCRNAVIVLAGARGAVIVAGALVVLVKPQPMDVQGGGEAAYVAEHDPTARGHAGMLSQEDCS